MKRVVTAIALSVWLAQPSAAQTTEELGVNDRLIGAGEAITMCANCPEFVRVPNPPTTMRAIRFVAKFELTWRNYLAAHDAGACPIPNGNSMSDLHGRQEITPNISNLRIDWPISELGPHEVECYRNWLQGKTRFAVALPTGSEWEWFARAGRDGAKFPWGEAEDPTREALEGNSTLFQYASQVPYGKGGKFIPGVKVDMFPPNRWGLFDIMGNTVELTSDIKSDVSVRTLVKGSNLYFKDWRERGIGGENYVLTYLDRYSADVSVRFVLVDKGS
jgi:formylglycine-generating enzyme required for sulfatase activity